MSRHLYTHGLKTHCGRYAANRGTGPTCKTCTHLAALRGHYGAVAAFDAARQQPPYTGPRSAVVTFDESEQQ